MRRVWFKKEMKQAILEGRKSSTTRDHPLPLGQVLAVSGARFKAQPFAILEIQDRLPMKVSNVIRMFYREEGFETSSEMENYLVKNKLLQYDDDIFYHTFKVSSLEESPKKVEVMLK